MVATGVSINEGAESVTVEEDKTVQLTATVIPDDTGHGQAVMKG